MKIERFEDIEAWQMARELTRKVYKLKIITIWLETPGCYSLIHQLPHEI